MNYVPQLSTECCSSCGAEHPLSLMVLYRFEVICQACKADHDDATALAESYELQARSHEWFTSLSPAAKERKADRRYMAQLGYES